MPKAFDKHVVIVLLIITAIGGGLFAATWGLRQDEVERFSDPSDNPRVTQTFPAFGSIDAPTDTSIRILYGLPAGDELDPATLPGNVTIVRQRDNTPVVARVALDGAGGVIVVRPEMALEPATSYGVTVTREVRDTQGRRMLPARVVFTTARQ